MRYSCRTRECLGEWCKTTLLLSSIGHSMHHCQRWGVKMLATRVLFFSLNHHDHVWDFCFFFFFLSFLFSFFLFKKLNSKSSKSLILVELGDVIPNNVISFSLINELFFSLFSFNYLCQVSASAMGEIIYVATVASLLLYYSQNAWFNSLWLFYIYFSPTTHPS